MPSDFSRLRTIAAIRETRETFRSNQEMQDQFIYDLKYYLGLEGKIDEKEKLSYRQKYTTFAIVGGASTLLLCCFLFNSVSSLISSISSSNGQQNTTSVSPVYTPATASTSIASAVSSVKEAGGGATDATAQSDSSPITIEQISSQNGSAAGGTTKEYAIHEASATDVNAEAPVIVFEKPSIGETELQEAILTEQEAEKFMPGIGKDLKHLSSMTGRTEPFDLE
ncbi:MAG: hypothetical protein K2W95_05365 [Candidatus Obscuribacterales bacterium]|nr:hypothetical protein [Candidatus Obscuribacterales bacterium]